MAYTKGVSKSPSSQRREVSPVVFAYFLFETRTNRLVLSKDIS